MNRKQLCNNNINSDNHITYYVDKPRIQVVSMLLNVKHKLLPRRFLMGNRYMLTRFS